MRSGRSRRVYIDSTLESRVECSAKQSLWNRSSAQSSLVHEVWLGTLMVMTRLPLQLWSWRSKYRPVSSAGLGESPPCVNYVEVCMRPCNPAHSDGDQSQLILLLTSSRSISRFALSEVHVHVQYAVSWWSTRLRFELEGHSQLMISILVYMYSAYTWLLYSKARDMHIPTIPSTFQSKVFLGNFFLFFYILITHMWPWRGLWWAYSWASPLTWELIKS